MTGTIAFLLALCLTPAFSRTILEDPVRDFMIANAPSSVDSRELRNLAQLRSALTAESIHVVPFCLVVIDQ